MPPIIQLVNDRATIPTQTAWLHSLHPRTVLLERECASESAEELGAVQGPGSHALRFRCGRSGMETMPSPLSVSSVEQTSVNKLLRLFLAVFTGQQPKG